MVIAARERGTEPGLQAWWHAYDWRGGKPFAPVSISDQAQIDETLAALSRYLHRHNAKES